MSHLTSCTLTKSDLYLANSLAAAAVGDPNLYRLLTFHVPNLMSLFHCLCHTKGSAQAPGMYPFHNKASFYGAEFIAPHQPKSWRTNPCWLSVTAYSTCSQLRVNFTITFILKMFIQKPDNGPRGPKHAAYKNRRELQPSSKWQDFLFSRRVHTDSAAHTATYPMRFFIQGKQMVCDADHSPPSSTVVTNEWSCTSTPLHAFMHRNNVTFLLVMTHTIAESSCTVPGKLY